MLGALDGELVSLLALLALDAEHDLLGRLGLEHKGSKGLGTRWKCTFEVLKLTHGATRFDFINCHYY